MVDPNQSENQNLEVNTAGIATVTASRTKLPDFCAEQVSFWFWQVESAFIAGNIRSDSAKYHTIIGQLPTKTMFKLSDLRTTPPATGQMYETLKKRIIEEFSDSEETKISKLLSEMPLGDRKPSQLLAEMRSRSADTAVNDKLLHRLWSKNLPPTIRTILSADDAIELNAAAKMADRMMETMQNGTSFAHAIAMPSPTPNAINEVMPVHSKPSDPMVQLQQQISELTKEIRELRTSRSLNNTNSSNRSQTPHRDTSNKKEFDYCWWHHKHGANAQKCKEPCKFNQANNNSSN